MTGKNNFLSNDEFTEEVDANSLYSYVNQNDIVAIKKQAKVNVLISIAITFIVIAVLLSFMGFFLLYKGGDSIFINSSTKYNLFVTHTTSTYGGIIDSFKDYNSSDTAYVYKFNVQNNNNVSLKYDVVLENLSFSEGSNYNLINYSLLNFDNEMAMGTLDSVKSFKLLSRDIGSSVSDNYTLKLWSSSFPSSFSFKIDINV